MTNRGRHLLRVLAILLLVQWVAALEPCLRSLVSLSSAQAVELCSPSGTYRTILVDENGKEVPQAKAHAGCPLCQHVDPANINAPLAVTVQPAIFVVVEQQDTRQGLPPAPPRGPPQQPRAPPIA
jgi:hypothetical protein